jgi:hypothetical protein
MPIADRCTGDKVVRQTVTHTIGAMGGDARTYADGSTLDCCIQTPGASEITSYAARGQRLTHWVFFSADPNLTPDQRLKVTQQAGVTLGTAIYLRVLDCYAEGRPGPAAEDLLWVADCEQVSTRSEQ